MASFPQYLYLSKIIFLESELVLQGRRPIRESERPIARCAMRPSRHPAADDGAQLRPGGLQLLLLLML
jgi:hypothetical protein